MVTKPSFVVLTLANLIPIAGVLWLDWAVVDILLLYWTESVIIGVINVLRMISSESNNLIAGLLPAAKEQLMTAAFEKSNIQLPMTAIKSFVIPFFILHYGMFCFGHLAFVVSLFGNSATSNGIASSIPALSNSSFWIAAGAIAVSHLFSFYANFIGKCEYKRTGLGTLMHRPYGRIVVMHVSIIFGAGLVIWLGNPLPVLLVLVVAKTVLDLRLHKKERHSFALQA